MTSLFTLEKKDPVLLGIEAMVVLVTLICLPLWWYIQAPTQGNIALFLGRNLIPTFLFLLCAASAIQDARTGESVPYFFAIALGLYTAICVTEALQIQGASLFFGKVIESVTIGRLLVCTKPLIALLFCIALCCLIGSLEDWQKRTLCGAADIKCVIIFFFFPMDPENICNAVNCGFLLLLAFAVYKRFRTKKNLPVRGLPWLYAGTFPAMIYFF